MDFTFIGGHPMAGMEVAGYENATPTLYRGASMILTPYAETPRYAVDRVGEFFLTLGVWPYRSHHGKTS